MLSTARNWFGRMAARLRSALRRSAMARLPWRVPDVAAPEGRWLDFRFKDGRKLSFSLRGRRSELDYSIYLPAGCSRRDRLPLLVMLHGCQQSVAAFAAGTRMNELADRHRFMVLYPQQNQGANALGCWNWFDSTTIDGAGEGGLIAHLTRAVAGRYPVDTSRIYLAGMSAGGAMAAVLAACHGRLFAAAAIHSGLMYAAAASVTSAARAMREGSRTAPEASARDAQRIAGHQVAFVPTLVIHGDRDTVVHPDNALQITQQARTLATAVAGADSWQESVTTRQADTRSYQQHDFRAEGRVLLRRFTIHGLAHAWSGGDPQYPFNDAAGPSASELIWEFASEHRRQ